MKTEDTIWLIIGSIAVADCVLLPRYGLTGPGIPGEITGYIIVMMGISWGLRWYGNRASRFPSAIVQFWLFAHFGGLLTYVVMASTPYPMADDQLSRWDSMIGIDWLSWFHLATPYRAILHRAYTSIFPQMLVLLPLSCWKDASRIDDLLLASILSIVIATLGNALPPSDRSFVALRSRNERWRETILALHGHTMTTTGDTMGITTFPSFHACCAVLLTWTARGWKVFPAFLAINALMVLSAMSEGSHYGVDVLAGLATAAIAIAAVRAVQIRLTIRREIAGYYATLSQH